MTLESVPICILASTDDPQVQILATPDSAWLCLMGPASATNRQAQWLQNFSFVLRQALNNPGQMLV